MHMKIQIINGFGGVTSSHHKNLHPYFNLTTGGRDTYRMGMYTLTARDSFAQECGSPPTAACRSTQ